jgi:hypothetical protein
MENLLDFISKVAVTVASILGSIFLVYRFKKSREAVGILQIEIDLKANNYSAKHLIDVSIRITNVGKAAAYVSSDVYKNALLKARKVSCPDGDSSLHWEQFENQQLIDDVAYLDIFGSDYPDEPIIFEPNSTETYHVFFSTDYSGPIWIRAELMDKDGYSWVADRMFILSSDAVTA